MRLYSTGTRGLVDLPEPPGPVGMYVCGPTVYDRAHIGNARPYVLGSWYKRWLRERGYDVTLVHNITDVNDKIYAAAPGASAERAAEATEWYLEDVARFGLDAVDHYPRATESMEEIVRFIVDLIAGGYAYEIEGDVYFRVGRFEEYGRLSGQRLDQLEDEEDNLNPLKEDSRDFALWKANKPGEDTAWESPWGRGRPGWHIECSVMAERLLGPSFEIHGGGLDLVFPHHENEVAQSRALGHEFARIWMHNGMLRFTGEKMSKSVGNVATIKEVLDEWGVETTLLFFLTAQWRSPIDFSDETMEQAKAQWTTFLNAFLVGEQGDSGGPPWEDLQTALDDDFNTPQALAVMHEWRKAGNHYLLSNALRVFGLVARSETAPPELVALAEQRQQARIRGDYEAADDYRDRVDDAGWEIRDEPGGFRLVQKP
ncbi:MAG TPA: cysteine--tRNA ligase [Gaiellaceae bacterium]|nr:cysteine--tRNA ligase [Gaiellaceae bacterium]